jgi:hypothetical protein
MDIDMDMDIDIDIDMDITRETVFVKWRREEIEK